MRHAFLLAAFFVLSACATASKYTIEDRLRDLGLSRGQASCMADELGDRLNDRELRDFARFTDQITEPDSPNRVFAALNNISDERIARAVAASSLACAFSR